MLMHITLNFKSHLDEGGVAEPGTLLEMCRICNVPDPQLVKRFLQEKSFLFHAQYKKNGKRLVRAFSAPLQLRNFFFDPGRSRRLYSVPCIIGKLWEGVGVVLGKQLKGDIWSSHFWRLISGLRNFFTPKEDCQISSASLMLSAASIGNRSDSDSLLGFLAFLSKIPWLDIWFTAGRSADSEFCATAIAQWVCIALVGRMCGTPI